MTSVFKRVLAALALTAFLAGCGGGAYIEDGYDYADTPPAVSLASSNTSAFVGDVIRLVAAATDDYAIDHVDFFSVDAQGVATPITTLRAPPYTVDVIVPNSSTGVIYFMARAVDDVGQFSDSQIVAVSVVP
jgi:ABC-type glycerol-3-phosphate transport system substrate-binding protein